MDIMRITGATPVATIATPVASIAARCGACGADADHQPQELAEMWAENHAKTTGHDVVLTTTSFRLIRSQPGPRGPGCTCRNADDLCGACQHEGR